jgi:hypothetical protein
MECKELPYEIWAIILGHLDTSDLREVELVNRTFHKLAWKHQTKLTFSIRCNSKTLQNLAAKAPKLNDITISNCDQLNDSDLANLSNLTTLKSLTVFGCKNIENFLFLTLLTSLESISICRNEKCVSFRCSLLRSLKHLTQISFRYCSNMKVLDTSTIDLILILTKLQVLELPDLVNSHSIVPFLQPLPSDLLRTIATTLSHLTKLDWSYNFINTDCFSAILQMTQLRHLVLTSADEYTSSSTSPPPVASTLLARISELSNLDTLVLDYWKYFRDDEFTVLSSLHNLTTLKMNNTTFSSVSAAAISELPKLKILEVKYCNINDSVIETLSTLTTLETFEFHSGWTNITNRSLPHLSKFMKLTELSLDKSKITDDGLVYLSALTLLTYLSLSNTLVSTKGIAYLSTLRYLRNLYLDHCYHLTEQIGSTLAKMPYLDTLSLEDCPTKSLDCFKYMNQSTILRCLNCNQNLNRVRSKVIKQIASKFPQLQSLSLSGSRISCTSIFPTLVSHHNDYCCFIS